VKRKDVVKIPLPPALALSAEESLHGTRIFPSVFFSYPWFCYGFLFIDAFYRLMGCLSFIPKLILRNTFLPSFAWNVKRIFLSNSRFLALANNFAFSSEIHSLFLNFRFRNRCDIPPNIMLERFSFSAVLFAYRRVGEMGGLQCHREAVVAWLGLWWWHYFVTALASTGQMTLSDRRFLWTSSPSTEGFAPCTQLSRA
jgi:hypothetical protein